VVVEEDEDLESEYWNEKQRYENLHGFACTVLMSNEYINIIE
jgi:hypothetical protein